jgi:hypothetical protein
MKQTNINAWEIHPSVNIGKNYFSLTWADENVNDKKLPNDK